MQYLTIIIFLVGCISVAAPKSSIICHDYHLEHVVVQCLGHLIESAYVSVKCWYGEYI